MPRLAIRKLVEYRAPINLALSVLVGLVGLRILPFPVDNPFLVVISFSNPSLYSQLAVTYATLWITTPLVVISLISALATIAILRREDTLDYSDLPEYPTPRDRTDLFLVLGELHHPTRPIRVQSPTWL